MNRFTIPLLATTVGCFIFAVALNLFFVPHHFLSGGLTGIAMIIYYLTGLPIGSMNMIMNIPILFMAYRHLGKFYTVTTVFGTVLISVFIDSTSFLAASPVINDKIISAITGGVLMGIGSGILYRYNGSSGGLDVVAAIVKKYRNIEMGSVIFALNCIIVAVGAVIFTLELSICTLLGMYISANVTNRVVIGFSQRKAAFIVSERSLEIGDSIIRHLGHGATFFYGHGAFTGEDKNILFAVINLTQVARMKQLIKAIDPMAFIFIMDVTDVIGRGFTMPSIPSSFSATKRYFQNEDGKIVPTEVWKHQMESEQMHRQSDIPADVTHQEKKS